MPMPLCILPSQPGARGSSCAHSTPLGQPAHQRILFLQAGVYKRMEQAVSERAAHSSIFLASGQILLLAASTCQAGRPF